MLRHKLSQFADWKPPQYRRFTHLWKEFSFGHYLHNAEEGVLILSLSGPSGTGWGGDLYSTDKLLVPGHFLKHRIWTSWICSALKLSMTAFHRISSNTARHCLNQPLGPDAVWAALPRVINDSPKFCELLDGLIHKHFADFQLHRGSKNFGSQFTHLMKGYHFCTVFIITPLHKWTFKEQAFSSTAQLTMTPS